MILTAKQLIKSATTRASFSGSADAIRICIWRNASGLVPVFEICNQDLEHQLGTQRSDVPRAFRTFEAAWKVSEALIADACDNHNGPLRGSISLFQGHLGT